MCIRDSRSQVPRFLRWVAPIVVASVGVPDRRCDEFLGLDLVQARNENPNEVAAHIVGTPGLVRIDAARLAEVLEWRLGMLVIAPELVGAVQEAERRRLNKALPSARFGAEGAIASAGSPGEIDVGFINDRATMTAAPIRLDRHRTSFFSRRVYGGAGVRDTSGEPHRDATVLRCYRVACGATFFLRQSRLCG